MNKYKKRRQVKDKRFVKASVAATALISVALVGVKANEEGKSFAEYLTSSKIDFEEYRFDTHKRINALSENQVKYAAVVINDIVDAYMKDRGIMGGWHVIFVNELPYLVDLSTSVIIEKGKPISRMNYEASIYKLNVGSKRIDGLHDFLECVDTLTNYHNGTNNVTLGKAKNYLEEIVETLDLDRHDFFSLLALRTDDPEFIEESKNGAKEELDLYFKDAQHYLDCGETIGISSISNREEHALQRLTHQIFNPTEEISTSSIELSK